MAFEYMPQVSTGDSVTETSFNKIIKVYNDTGKLINTQIDNSQANQVGEAKLEIIDGVLVAKNLKGETGGFANPTASSYSLPSSSEPIVEITSSGSNSEKLLSFTFGIPKGQPGEQGIPGTNGLPGQDGIDGKDGIGFAWRAGWTQGTTYNSADQEKVYEYSDSEKQLTYIQYELLTDLGTGAIIIISGANGEKIKKTYPENPKANVEDLTNLKCNVYTTDYSQLLTASFYIGRKFKILPSGTVEAEINHKYISCIVEGSTNAVITSNIDINISYNKNDTVYYDNSVYICLKDNNNYSLNPNLQLTNPYADSENWSIALKYPLDNYVTNTTFNSAITDITSTMATKEELQNIIGNINNELSLLTEI